MGRRRLLLAGTAALTIAALVSVYVLSRSREDGGYGGLTAQRLPIRLTPSKDGKRLTLDVSWIARAGASVDEAGNRPCADPEIVRTVKHRVVRIRAGGQFSWKGRHVVPLADGDEERHRLRLQGRRNRDGTLSGTWSAQRSFLNGQAAAHGRPGAGVTECRSVDVSFGMREGGSARPPAPAD